MLIIAYRSLCYLYVHVHFNQLTMTSNFMFQVNIVTHISINKMKLQFIRCYANARGGLIRSRLLQLKDETVRYPERLESRHYCVVASTLTIFARIIQIICCMLEVTAFYVVCERRCSTELASSTNPSCPIGV